jgi:hypothetical protein
MRADKVVRPHRPEVACPALVVELHRLPLARRPYGRLHLTPAVGRESTRAGITAGTRPSASCGARRIVLSAFARAGS